MRTRRVTRNPPRGTVARLRRRRRLGLGSSRSRSGRGAAVAPFVERSRCEVAKRVADFFSPPQNSPAPRIFVRGRNTTPICPGFSLPARDTPLCPRIAPIRAAELFSAPRFPPSAPQSPSLAQDTSHFRQKIVRASLPRRTSRGCLFAHALGTPSTLPALSHQLARPAPAGLEQNTPRRAPDQPRAHQTTRSVEPWTAC